MQVIAGGKRHREASMSLMPSKQAVDEECPEGELPLIRIEPQLTENSTYVLVAKRNSGKSVLALHILVLLFRRKLVDYAVSFSGSQQFNNDWKCLFPKNRIEGFDDDKLRQLIEFQQNEKRQQMKSKGKYKGKRLLIILDDIIGQEQGTEKSKNLDYVLSAGRHILITIIVIVQYGQKVISPTVRNNIDFMAISRNNPSVMDQLYGILNGFCGSKKEFRKFVFQNTTGFSFLWWNNTREARDLGTWHRVSVSADEKRFQDEFQLQKNKKSLY